MRKSSLSLLQNHAITVFEFANRFHLRFAEHALGLSVLFLTFKMCDGDNRMRIEYSTDFGTDFGNLHHDSR